MTLDAKASAGIEQSNDISVTISPAEVGAGLSISLRSPVKAQFGRTIESIIRTILIEQGVSDASVVAVDQGALDYAIRARVLCALARAHVPSAKA